MYDLEKRHLLFGKGDFLKEYSGLSGPTLVSGNILCSQSAHDVARIANLESGTRVDLRDVRSCIQFSPDSSIVATYAASSWNVSQIWEVKGGIPHARHQLPSGSESDYSLLMLPDNRRAVIRDDAGRILIWDFIKDEFSAPLATGESHLLAVSRTGNTLAIATQPNLAGAEIEFIDLRTGHPSAHYPLEGFYSSGYSASPDHRVLAVVRTSKPTVTLLNLEDGSRLGVLDSSGFSHAFSADGSLLATVSTEAEVRAFRILPDKREDHVH
jgi:WD40 repeat protein